MTNKRQFNDEDILYQVSTHFWKHGYFSTRVDDLSKSTGLTKSSLYNAFGNKESLFLSSINFYVENSIIAMKTYYNKKYSLSENFENILTNTFISKNKEILSYGCFLTNSIVELNATDPNLHKKVTALYDKVRQVKLEFISHYIELGRVQEGITASELTDYYLTFWQGLRVQTRNQAAPIKLKRSIQLFLKFIRLIEKN